MDYVTVTDMALKDEIKTIIGNRRKFLLLRVADVDVETARKLCNNTKKSTYNSWLQDQTFVALYRRRDEFSSEFKHEAIQLLRRDNQLNAVILEEKILQKMKDEIESGEYSLIRTHLARDVYSKLVNDLDYQPQSLALTWQERFEQLNLNLPNQDGGNNHGTEVISSEGSESPEHQESLLITQGEQTPA